MDKSDIQLAENPAEVAQMLGPEAASVDPTFAQTLAQIEADKQKKAEDAAKLAELTEKAKPQPKPLQLKYRYEGQDSKGHEVKTIVNTFNGETVASAFCITCDETILQIKVQPIDNPKIEPIPEPEKPLKAEESAPIDKSAIMVKKEKKNANL